MPRYYVVCHACEFEQVVRGETSAALLAANHHDRTGLDVEYGRVG